MKQECVLPVTQDSYHWRHRFTAVSQNTLTGTPPLALIHLSFLLPVSLSAPLPYRLHLLSEWICIVSTEIFFHLMNFARKLAEADSGFHTCGRNGSSGIKKKADYKPLASSSTVTSHGKCHSLRDRYNCFPTDWINDPWLHNAHNLFLSLFFPSE